MFWANSRLKSPLAIAQIAYQTNRKGNFKKNEKLIFGLIFLLFQAGMFNFRPSVRPVPLEVHISGYPGKHYCPRMATMNKPTFAAIRTHSPTKPVLVFVSSRRQTRLTALELISFLAAEDNPKQWLHMPEAEVRR